ncbi:DUF3592 domain-containing protein [Roseobacter sinensis]|uniref:DUF3592 domain-containing protein n=1 Tax=Roseobacter sinensis TaxID=2931391 RepID=A0ABT3BLJ0_9RHOB|nr:DUF3592 domain-containing protein [Roseobacter sp. WL0113]MCV3274435.1 DUF3592 domain-containing protein [Roseobacter sp. WL0113]
MKEIRNRPRSWFGMYCRLLGVYGWLYWILLLVGFFVLWNNASEWSQLDASSETVSAEIVDVAYRLPLSQAVTFGYTVDGVDYEGTLRMAAESFDQTDIGRRVDIQYLPDDPKVFDLIDSERLGRSVVVSFFLAVALLFLPIKIFLFGRKASRAIKARDQGQRITARVTGYRKRSGFWSLVWQRADGHEGESLSYLEEEVKAWPVGDKIYVYVLGNDCWWKKDVGPRDVSA